MAAIDLELRSRSTIGAPWASIWSETIAAKDLLASITPVIPPSMLPISSQHFIGLNGIARALLMRPTLSAETEAQPKSTLFQKDYRRKSAILLRAA